MKHLLTAIAALIALTCCTTEAERTRMRSELDSINQRNRNDLPFTIHDVKPYVRFFDDHGSPNDRLLAHYLLGRAYHEQGEAPMALQCYQDALDCADTLSPECDYEQIEIVYTQMSNIFYYHCLYQEQLNTLSQAMYYAALAKDTLGLLLAYTQKMGGYELLSKPDSMLHVCNEVSRLFLKAGYPQLAAAVQANPVGYLIEKGELEEAHKHLRAYEEGAGYFDRNNNIEQGREIYYYYKGLYYLAACQYDSAEYFFRKDLHLGKDYNNQNSASKGLALLFQKTHQPDSAAKYALYSYEMNDSMHLEKYAHEIGKMKAFYDYSHYQHIALSEKQKSERRLSYLLITSAITVSLFLIIVFIIMQYRKLQAKQMKEEHDYYDLLATHEHTKQELTKLREHLAQLQLLDSQYNAAKEENGLCDDRDNISQTKNTIEYLIRLKEKEMHQQEEELARYKQQAETIKKAANTELIQLYQDDFYADLVKIANKGRALSDTDWTRVEEFVKNNLPEFCEFLKKRRGTLTNYEYRVALLVRLHFKPKSISAMMSLDGSYVNRVRRSLLKKLFSTEGNAQQADLLIREIGQHSK